MTDIFPVIFKPYDILVMRSNFLSSFRFILTLVKSKLSRSSRKYDNKEIDLLIKC